MARKHDGGFISVDNYWNIGTPDRGQDGDTAREAAKKYNDHRHNAIVIDSAQSMLAWVEEKQLSSFHPDNPHNQGGVIDNDLASSIRRPGDIALYNDLLWMSNGTSVVCLGNPAVFLAANGQAVRKTFVNEYPFAVYGEHSWENAPLLDNKPKKYVGSVVLNYSHYTLNPDNITSTVEVVAGIRSALLDQEIINIAADHPEVALLLTENGGLSLRATLRVERYTLIPDPVIEGEGRFLINIDENIEMQLSAYSEGGYKLLIKNLPFVSEATYMYNLYIIKPTAQELLDQLVTTPELLATLIDLGIESRLADIIDDASIEIVKASVKVRNLA